MCVGLCVYLSRAAGSSGRWRGSLVHIPAVLLTREPWPSEPPSSCDAASPLKDEDSTVIFIKTGSCSVNIQALYLTLHQEISKAFQTDLLPIG